MRYFTGISFNLLGEINGTSQDLLEFIRVACEAREARNSNPIEL